MFKDIQGAPRDPILGLMEQFAQDPNPEKINLGVGVYQDASARTPVLESVKQAEKRIFQEESSKTYLGIAGSPEYSQAVQELVLGAGCEVLGSQRVATVHTPGGTGALRVAGDFIRKMFPKACLWLSQPTWPNHANVFAAAGVKTKNYPYFDRETGNILFNEWMDTIKAIPAGDVILLHGCCHNPTGVDPTSDQWQQIAQVVYDGGLLPMLDFAYQGFAFGLAEDAAGIRAFCREGKEFLICSSFSKNMGLYRERVGALTVVAGHRDVKDRVLSQIKTSVRSNYSNPPGHGGAIVTTILTDNNLRRRWQQEVVQMRNRINSVRSLLVKTFEQLEAPRDFSFLSRQRGMFSISGLAPEQVDILREQHSIYMVRSGRVNVAGITEQNVGAFCSAVVSVLSDGLA